MASTKLTTQNPPTFEYYRIDGVEVGLRVATVLIDQQPSHFDYLRMDDGRLLIAHGSHLRLVATTRRYRTVAEVMAVLAVAN